MRKILISLAVLFLLSACSFDQVIELIITPTHPPPPPPTATPTVYQTPSKTPTATTVPTYTATPTLGQGIVGAYTEASELDQSYMPTLYVVPTSTPAPKPMPLDSDSFFSSLTISGDILYWGYCDKYTPKYIDFEVLLANKRRVTYVLLFMRLVDKGGNQSTAWGGGAIMERVNRSHYTYRVRPENIQYYEEFEDAWIEYQIVAATSWLQSLGRSPVYLERLSLEKCVVSEEDD